MKFAMMDFETLSLRPDAVILSGGIVHFDENFKAIDTCRVVFNLDTQLKAGRHIDSKTLRWWSRQENFTTTLGETSDSVSMSYILNLMLPFLQEARDGIWTNGHKDIEWLESLARDFNTVYQLPHYRLFRDFRTIRELAYSQGYNGAIIDFETTKHDPVDDCRWQVAELKGCFDYLGLSLHEAR